MIRNVPFQATDAEVQQLFESFGELVDVRLSHKATGGHRGFAFVQYSSAEEAKVPKESLERSHMYGRKLVIEFAAA